ncbi:hypothetical protein [Aureimonas sp. Leaf454]|nr:hypothetical protein [Aureimonas sp. Leaf454]
MSAPLIAAATALVKAVQADNSHHGGLITRDTLRKSDELRIEVAKVESQR